MQDSRYSCLPCLRFLLTCRIMVPCPHRSCQCLSWSVPCVVFFCLCSTLQAPCRRPPTLTLVSCHRVPAEPAITMYFWTRTRCQRMSSKASHTSKDISHPQTRNGRFYCLMKALTRIKLFFMIVSVWFIESILKKQQPILDLGWKLGAIFCVSRPGLWMQFVLHFLPVLQGSEHGVPSLLRPLGSQARPHHVLPQLHQRNWICTVWGLRLCKPHANPPYPPKCASLLLLPLVITHTNILWAHHMHEESSFSSEIICTSCPGM